MKLRDATEIVRDAFSEIDGRLSVLSGEETDALLEQLPNPTGLVEQVLVYRLELKKEWDEGIIDPKTPTRVDSELDLETMWGLSKDLALSLMYGGSWFKAQALLDPDLTNPIMVYLSTEEV